MTQFTVIKLPFISSINQWRVWHRKVENSVINTQLKATIRTKTSKCSHFKSWNKWKQLFLKGLSKAVEFPTNRALSLFHAWDWKFSSGTTILAALTDEIDFEIYLKCFLFVCLFFKPAHPCSRTPVAIKTPGVWFFLWSSGRTPSILHFIVCLSPAVSLQQCHSSLRCISSLQLCLVAGMKLGLHATVICWRKLQAIRSWTLRTSRLRSPPTSG